MTPAFDGGAFAEDPYGYIATIPNMSLPDFAAWFCCEPDNDKAKRRYGAFCKERGSARFRSLLVSFVGEVNAGEEPDNRGAAFTRRVMDAWRP